MKLRSLTFSIFLLLPTLAGLRADTVVLKTGESLEGKILTETADAVVIEYHVSASITDQRTVPRAEIDKVEKEKADEIAYASIQGYKVDPEWSMQIDNYIRDIQILENFLGSYPNSPHASQVKENAKALAAEQTRVSNGELKLFGNWLGKDQAEKQQIQAQAQAAFAAMREKAAQGDTIGALNLFEEMKGTYSTALVYPGAVKYAAALISNLKRQVAAQKQALLKEEDNWTKTIGMALSDVGYMVASQLATIPRSKFTADMAALDAVLTKHNVGGTSMSS